MIKTEQARRPRTATPSKYPQGYFKPKPCRCCGTQFQPDSPSQLYCSIPCAEEAQRNRYYKKKYGIDTSEWNKLYVEQNGLCFICEGEGFVMRDCHEAKLMVDHCHSTGKVRGLLCHNCNRALGLLQDDLKSLSRAIQYLERATTIPQGSTAKRLEAHGPS